MKNKILVTTFVLTGLFIATPALAQLGTPTSPASPVDQKQPVPVPTTKSATDVKVDAKTSTTVAPAPVPTTAVNADLNADGRIEFADLSLLLGAFGKCHAISGTISTCPEDFSGDRVVDEDDLDIMRRAWSGGPSSEIASMISTCRTLDPEAKFLCFARLAQQLEVGSKEKVILASIQSSTVVLPKSDAGSGLVESAIRNTLIHIHNLLNRGYATVKRLDILADRIESRIDKEEAVEGANLSETRRLLAEARVKLAEARKDLGEISVTYEKLFQNNPGALFEQIRSMVDSIKESRRLLLGAVEGL